MRNSLIVLLALTPVTLSGCGFLRNVEQWKCDNLGMCHFGITPTVSHAHAWENNAQSPPPFYSDPGEVMMNPPLPSTGVPGMGHPDMGFSGSGLPAKDCPNCAR
jgi:hypothetical protein